jgi:hypothetical protein
MKPLLLIQIMLTGIGLLLNSAWADSETLGYKIITLSHFPKVEWVIPQTLSNDRIYIRAKMHQPVTQAQLIIDQQVLVHPIGNAKSASIPAELAAGYQKQYSDIQIFPLSPLKQANHQIQIGWSLDNGKQKRFTIQGKPFQKFLKSIPSN